MFIEVPHDFILLRSPWGLGDSPYETVLERGDFWSVISGLIRERKIDLVVTGTRGRQVLSKLVLGSNAEKIFRRANCPVLTIGA